MSNTKKRYLFFWVSYTISYLFPLVYFLCKLGITKSSTSIVMPVLLLAFIAIVKLCIAIPSWVSTWKPSFLKGVIKAIPTYLLFIAFITLGLVLKHVIEKQITAAFLLYFEVIIVMFGSSCVGSIFGALHLKYKELDLIDKGYVLGVVNK
jgi:hypothetical protein